MGSEHTTTDSDTSTLKDFVLSRKGRDEKSLGGQGKQDGGRKTKQGNKKSHPFSLK